LKPMQTVCADKGCQASNDPNRCGPSKGGTAAPEALKGDVEVGGGEELGGAAPRDGGTHLQGFGQKVLRDLLQRHLHLP